MCFTVRTPASSANLGPGFDALGLPGLWNEATIDPSGEPGLVTLRGTEAGLLDGRENLALTAMKRLAHETGRALPPFSLVVHTDVPVARGLGSSAAAHRRRAGVAANHLLATSLPVSDLYSLAWQMEGHGDNVGAALYGGAVLAVPEVANPVQLLTHGRLDLCAVVFIPQVTGLTRAARAALPPTVPHADAAFNVAAAGGLVLGLHRRHPPDRGRHA